MPRQRFGLPHSWATRLGQILLIVPAAGLLYGGLVVLGLGLGVPANDVQAVSGYQTVYERLGALNPSDWSQQVTIGVAVGGAIGFLLLASLGWAQRLIPHVTRSAIVVRAEDDGTTTVAPRAVERAVEIAARHEGIRAARATLGEADLHIALHARRADQLPSALAHAKSRAVEALRDAGLSQQTDVRVTITRFSPASKKELLK